MEVLRIIALPFYSLLSRLRKGEGALLFLVLFLSWRSNPQFDPLILHGLLAFFSISLMYALNDIHDAPMDSRDPSRENLWVTLLARRQGVAYGIHIAEVLLFLSCCMFAIPLGITSVVLTFALSTIYSLSAKGRPGFDIVTVFLWGPFFINSFVPATSYLLLLNAGFMLAMSHTFQMYRDLLVDTANGIKTTVVYGKRLSAGIFIFCAFASVACFLGLGKMASAMFAFVAAILPLFIKFTPKCWILAKLFQALAWLAIMVK